MINKTKKPEQNSTLVNRCKKGDNRAYKELYELYAKAMYNISLRIINNSEDANDILQEAFIKAFQSIEKFENQAAFGGWLKRVVINQSIDVVRKKKENFISIDNLGNTEEEDEIETSGENIEYDVESIREAMQELPDGYRVVLTLYLFEEYSHKEISTMLNISEGTSKSQYNRAKKKIVQLIHQKNYSHA